MALFNRDKNRAEAEKWAAEARKHTKEAREEGRKADSYRKAKSSDPAADRYMADQHDGNKRVAAANARDSKEIAKQTRKSWF